MITMNKLKESSSTPLGVMLTPNESKEYLDLTQAAKFASISFVAQTDNASVCLSHSSRPWILDSGASNHFSGNKDMFSSLTFTSPLPMVTLANGSQTMVKGISSARLLPSLPLNSILYVPNSPFNLITFSDNSVTLQDQSMGRMIDIGHES